jgi:hypothetical protein
VQNCVAEDGIELFSEWQRFSVYYVRVQSQFPRRLDLRCARIDGDHSALVLDQLFRECPVSATQVENALAGQGSLTDQACVTPGSRTSDSERPAYESLKGDPGLVESSQ